MTSFHLTHLKQLEAESIEVAAEFDKPVMPYSIGKDADKSAPTLETHPHT